MTILDWLLDSDPAIRWQVLRDLGCAGRNVAAERARVATAASGWGARILALQGDDGQWEGGALLPGREAARRARRGQPWTATAYSLVLLQDCGVDPRRTTRAPRGGAGQGALPLGARRSAVFRRRGRAVHQRDDRLARRVLRCGCRRRGRSAARRAAGGRRLELRGRERVGAILVPHDHLRPRRAAGVRAATGDSPAASAARRRGEEYLLERQLFRRKSTGEVIDPAFLQFSFPDALALRRAARPGVLPGRRRSARPAHRRSDGRWSDQAAAGRHVAAGEHASGAVHFQLEDGDGRPSRWNTLRALRVLRWCEP